MAATDNSICGRVVKVEVVDPKVKAFGFQKVITEYFLTVIILSHFDSLFPIKIFKYLK